MVQAIIVAAGIGSRLFPITNIIPKIMLPVGKNEKPIAHHIIEHCKAHGITEIVFCINEKFSKQVKNWFEDGERSGVSIKYSCTPEPLGTAGEIMVAYERGLINPPSLIYYGDTLCSTNLTEMMKTHDYMGYKVSLVVNNNIRIPVGYVEDVSGKVTLLKEKPTLAELAEDKSYKAGGVLPIFYVTHRDFFKRCNEGLDIVNDVLKGMISNYYIGAFHDDRPFLDCGDWKNYERAKEWMA